MEYHTFASSAVHIEIDISIFQAEYIYFCISCGIKFSSLWQIPFSVILRKPGEENLEKIYETFHGANISIQVNNST